MTATTKATPRVRAKSTKRKPLDVYQLTAEAMLLSPHGRVLLIQQFAYSLLAARPAEDAESRGSIMDSLAYPGYSPTTEEIDAARHEAWCGHPCAHAKQ